MLLKLNFSLIINYIIDNAYTKSEFCECVPVRQETFDKIFALDDRINLVDLLNISRHMNLALYDLFFEKDI